MPVMNHTERSEVRKAEVLSTQLSFSPSYEWGVRGVVSQDAVNRRQRPLTQRDTKRLRLTLERIFICAQSVVQNFVTKNIAATAQSVSSNDCSVKTLRQIVRKQSSYGSSLLIFCASCC